jgi:OmpA-OmpF porin, OOP family
VQILKDNPAITVLIRSHTDSVGKDDYNLKLSDARANSVVVYLKNKGIEQERLESKGMGETEFIAPNSLPNGKDNPEGRALNRRTDFKITGTIPGKEIIYEQGNVGFDENEPDTLEEQKKQEEQK